ncbi:hypothetical protein ACWDHH_04350 [Janibacter hoylei]
MSTVNITHLSSRIAGAGPRVVYVAQDPAVRKAAGEAADDWAVALNATATAMKSTVALVAEAKDAWDRSADRR